MAASLTSHPRAQHASNRLDPPLPGSSNVFNPCVYVQLQQQPGLETIPAERPTDIESNSSLSEDGGELSPGKAYAKPSAPR